MTAPRDPDAGLAARLGELLDRVEPAPDDLARAAKDLWTWRTVDAELADIGFDSLLDAPTGVRSAGGPRTVTFEGGGLVVDVEVVEDGTTRRLVGQLAPAGPARVDVLADAGEPAGGTDADELGRFALDLPARRTRLALRCAVPGGPTVRTAWLVL